MPAVATAAGLPTRLGKYELLLPLAAGGMARIYIGRSTGIGSFERHVVLKMITPERANDANAVNMFLDEARLAASLNHQNVAQVFEVGEDGGIHFLAMEYVHGQDLRAVLAKAGSHGTRIPLELSLTAVAGAAAGLHHAHERRGPDGTPLGIVHRDVSPSNIMIGYDGAVKLLDFGIAKATARSVETQSGIIKGKFAYMAPEQCRGRDVDRRSDVFSLGIILYEISTQHRCFRADSDFDTMHRIVTGDVVRPTRLVTGYPQALEAIVMKALAVDATQRYQSAGALLEAIESYAVSTRMSLSTMGLGRFMRDMFGEVAEPWLTASSRMSAPVISNEYTISSTDSKSEALPLGPDHGHAPEQLDEAFPLHVPFEESDSSPLAATILEVPRGSRGETQDPSPAADWNPKAYPSSEPSHESHRAPAFAPRATPEALTLQPGAEETPPPLPPVPTFRTSQVQAPVHVTPYKAPIVIPPPDLALRPNRRPLWIGLVMVLVAGGAYIGWTRTHSNAAGTEARAAQPEAEPAATGSETAPPAPEDNMVSVVIESDPTGADVLIAGAKIGETPFDKKFARGTKVQVLTVRKAGFAEWSGKIDFAGEYENRNIKLNRLDEAPGSNAIPDKVEQTPPESDDADKKADTKPETTAPDTSEKKQHDKSSEDKKANRSSGTTTRASTTSKTTTTPKSGARSTSGSSKLPEKPEKPKCQPPGPNVDPFSSIPICPAK